MAAPLPLKNVRVANFGWVWAGPVAGQTLAFLGAEVYKVESRARIDINRTLPPFGEGVNDPDRSLQNHAAWAGNGSITLNLKEPEGVQLATQLVAKSDVVIENFGPGAMDKLNLGYDELKKVKPDIVMLSMPTAGLSGPLKNVRAYGMSLTSITGLDSITGYRDGPPIPVENAFPDPYNGVMGAFAVLVALTHRDRTGTGQHIDYSQQESIMQLAGPAFMDYVMNDRAGAPKGNRHPTNAGAPHGVFPCQGDDRWISIAVMTDDEWQGLRTAMDDPDWAQNDDYANAAGRVANIDALHEQLAAWVKDFDDHDLAEKLQSHGVAAAPVLCIGDLLDDPHFTSRGTYVEMTHPLGFKETIYGSYVKSNKFEAAVRPGPMIGQDNDYVFKELLELPEDRYRDLIEREIIY
jgi:benzylsuccinate CoA-transferase BbsF subunit